MKHQHETAFTAEDFERWLALQKALGFTVRNPDAVEKVRAEFQRRGPGHLQKGIITHEN